MLDLTPEGQKHQRIVSVGHDPLVEQHQSLYLFVSQGLYQSHKEKNEIKAFSFQLQLQPQDLRPELSLDIRMASLCYTHSVHFLAEVTACVSEFQQAVLNLATSLKVLFFFYLLSKDSSQFKSSTKYCSPSVSLREAMLPGFTGVCRFLSFAYT